MKLKSAIIPIAVLLAGCTTLDPAQFTATPHGLMCYSVRTMTIDVTVLVIGASELRTGAALQISESCHATIEVETPVLGLLP